MRSSKIHRLFEVVFLSVVLVPAYTFSQTIPDDPIHLPKKIGGEPKGNSRVNSITVSGKVKLEGFPAGKPRPVMYVSAYLNGRFVVRRQVPDNGSYSLTDVPRGESTIVLEIDHAEVASRLLTYTPADIVYHDFSVNWQQFLGSRERSGVVSAAVLYERSQENQLRFDRALTDMRSGKNDSAIKDLRAVVDKDPKDYYAWTQLGNAYFLQSDTKRAEAAYTKAISVNPAYGLAMINLGKLYLSQKENDRAIEVLTKAVESNPGSPDAQQYLGEAYLAIKKGSKAVVYLNEAIRLAPLEKAEVHLRLAALYDGAGLKPRASAEYEAFLEKVPNYERKNELRKYIAENPSRK